VAALPWNSDKLQQKNILLHWPQASKAAFTLATIVTSFVLISKADQGSVGSTFRQCRLSGIYTGVKTIRRSTVLNLPLQLVFPA